MSQLLESNNPPLHTERPQLEGFISENLEFVASLQERVSKAWAVLNDLLKEQRGVKDMIESCKTIIRPIRKVPEDIVREIFLALWDTEEEGKDSLNKRFAPLVVSQVCRDWRNIALSMSQLWSTITLDFDQHPNELRCQYLLQTYLVRSANHDIILSIRSKRDISKSPVIPALLLSAPRWTNISMIIPYKSRHAFSAARGFLHSLNHLSVELTEEDYYYMQTTESLFDAFEYAPLLRSLSLKGISRSTRQTSLPWSQLTDYTGDDGSSYMDVLKRAPDMERASLQCFADGTHQTSSHQRLRILHVHEVERSPYASDSAGGILQFLSCVEFPALESLHMTYAHTRNVLVPKSLLGSTVSSLKSLSIDARSVLSSTAQADFLSLLKTTESLSSLSLPCRFEPNQNKELLTGLNANMNPTVVPRLSSLTIRITNEKPFLQPSFIEMVQSRRYPALACVALESLRLSVPFIVMPANKDALPRWKDICDGDLVTYGME
ncbi:uncharacterized protein ARMOST_06186 [Armillaria ostoyae]|uniref:Uncharacterized protein n=1 Tax=Armillaria ostoyae TaxID=47428 RepID=A0A284R2A8_ARMOS|nr:uncharacterized protein ARMOST_06186 [Armillaria ostoyae]